MKYLLLVFIVLVLGIALIAYVYSLEPSCDPNEWNCENGYIEEKIFDSTIVAPTMTMGLGYMAYDPSVDNTYMCNPMWYAIRYVRVSDGGYGPLSQWVGPIAGGALNLPCLYDGVVGCTECPAAGVSTGQASSAANIARIYAVGTPDYDLTQDEYFVNVHRQVGTQPDLDSEGVVVGLLLPGFLPSSSIKGLYYTEDGSVPVENSGSLCNVSGKC